MPNYISDNGYICYVRSGINLSHTHGGAAGPESAARAALHKDEIEAIANEIADKKINMAIKAIKDSIPMIVEQYGEQVWRHLIESLIGVITHEINSDVSIGVNGIRDILRDRRTEQYLSKAITETMIRELKGIRSIKIDI